MNKELIDIINKEVCATLAPSKIHGIGVFAIKNITKGSQLFMWSSRFISMETEEFLMLSESIRNMILDKTLHEDMPKIMFRHPNCIARLQCFMNHEDEPNSNGHVALRDIKVGEEITENFNDIINGNLHKLQKERMKFLYK